MMTDVIFLNITVMTVKFKSFFKLLVAGLVMVTGLAGGMVMSAQERSTLQGRPAAASEGSDNSNVVKLQHDYDFLYCDYEQQADYGPEGFGAFGQYLFERSIRSCLQ